MFSTRVLKIEQLYGNYTLYVNYNDSWQTSSIEHEAYEDYTDNKLGFNTFKQDTNII